MRLEISPRGVLCALVCACRTPIAVLCILLSLLPSISGSAQELLVSRPTISTKLDPALEQYLVLQQLPATARRGAASLSGIVRAGTTDSRPMVEVLVSGDERSGDAVMSVGGRIGSRHGRVITAAVPADALASLCAHPGITAIEASHHLYPSLATSVPATGAHVLHAQSDPARRLTGKGVIIGFTDSGINTLHRTFRTPGNRTRILSVWDQYGSGTPPAGFSYGAERDSAAMNAGRWWMYDVQEHGTHVAGIAAGNGLPDATFVGMAPEADIIMVCNRPDDLWSAGLSTAGTLDGYDYIRSRAMSLGKRHVINTSQATNLGPHDGTSLFEQAVDADVAGGSVICLAAGNEATSSRHASAIVPPGGAVEIRFRFRTLSPFDSSAIPMEVWYGGNDRLDMSCRMAATEAEGQPVTPGTTGVIAFDSVVVAVTSIVHSPLNGDNVIRCTVVPAFPIASDDVGMVLRFEAIEGQNLPDGGRIDLWWERNFDVAWSDHVDESITFGMPAGAGSAITVGACENTGTNAGMFSEYSARGPRRDGTLKPDIVAAGGGVTSAVPGGGYRSMSGTSMAAPHVAGAAALLLERHPLWTPAQVKTSLLSSAAADESTGPLPNASWGSGKLNVWRAVNGETVIPAAPVLQSVRQNGEDIVLTWGDPSATQGRTLWRVFVYREDRCIDSVAGGVGTYRDQRPGAGKHTYHLTAAWSDGWLSARSVSLSVELFLAGHPWLLVDDDAGSQFEPYYMSALDATGTTFDRWTTITTGAVTPEALLQYVRPDGGVIWFCGNDYTATLTPAEQAALAAYLDAGGHLFISGQDIGYGLTQRGTDMDRSFYASYLKAVLAMDGTGVFALKGSSGRMFNSMHFRISGGDGADNQVYPSAIAPLSPAQSVLTYQAPSSEDQTAGRSVIPDPSRPVLSASTAGSLTGAVAYENGSLRVVYFAFGFEAIDSITTRRETMARVLTWLTPRDTVCASIARSAQWSLRSVPVHAPSMRAGDVLRGGSPEILGFRGEYVPLDTLACGEGFWVRDAADVVQEVCGDTSISIDVPVRAGWNLVAPFHRSVPVRNVSTIPPHILSSAFFGFSGYFTTATVLQPGCAYWVKVTTDGMLRMDNSPIE